MKQCKQCQAEYEPKTAASEYCSGACRAQTSRSRALMSDLPQDVQDQIELHCAENNKGERAGSHSRAAMTERALSYQAMFGKRHSVGISNNMCVTDLLKPGEPGYKGVAV